MSKYREESKIGDYGKLDYRAERWEPELFKKVWHHNGIVKAVWKENGKEMLAVSFMGVHKGDEAIVVPSYCFENFTKENGYKPSNDSINETDCDPEVLRIIKKAENDFYARQ